MTKLFAALSAAAALLYSASAQQLCGTDRFCAVLGGTCLTTQPAGVLCSKSVGGKALCGTSADCTCCFRDCAQTRECKAFGGKCIKREECQGENLLWEPDLCLCRDDSSDPTTAQKDCGCCIEVAVPCKQTDKCKENGGRCAKRERCPSTFTWNPELCEIDAAGNEVCGCCIPPQTAAPTPSEPCKQTDKCKESGGRCAKRERCPSTFTWNPELCEQSAAGAIDCGCCIRPTQPPSQSEPCEQTPKCQANGGLCIKREQCPDTHDWKAELCQTNPDGTEDCGCCIPKQLECQPAPECEAVDGRCVTDPAHCPAEFILRRELCPDPACACCFQEG